MLSILTCVLSNQNTKIEISEKRFTRLKQNKRYVAGVYIIHQISALVGTVCGNYGLQAVPNGADYFFLVGLVHVAPDSLDSLSQLR